MARQPIRIKLKKWIQAPPNDVYAAFTTAVSLREWLCSVAEAAPYKGGRLYLFWQSGFYASGEYTALKPGEKVAFSWHGRNEPGQTQVRILLKEEDEGTLVSLVHEELGDSRSWRKIAREFRRGWKTALQNLKSVLETGQDLRLLHRPILGISGLSEIGPENLAEGQAIKRGVRIEGLLESFGAQQAGLKAGDILTRVGKTKIDTAADVAQALRGHSAGDQLKVTYYRGGEKGRTVVELSAQPLPEVPPSLAELSQRLEAIYHDLDATLKDCFTGVSEDEAAYRPDPHGWSAMDVLAHLIASERETHSWVAGLIEGQEGGATLSANLPSRLRAILGAFPSVSALLDELRLNQAETVTLVANLPPEFSARKGSYWRLGVSLLSASLHFQEHVQHIRALLAAALSRPEPAAHPAEVQDQP